MKKIMGLILSSMILFSCNSEDKSIETKISTKINKNQALHLSNYNDFEWNSLIILGPYSNIEKIEKEKEINLGNVSNSIEYSDDKNLPILKLI